MRRILRLCMTSVFVANGVAFGSWVAILPRLLDQAGLDKTQLGLVLLAVAGGASVALPAAGMLAGRIGSARLAMLAGLGLAAALPVVPAMASDWVTLLSAAAVLGVAIGTMDVCMNAAGTEAEIAWGSPVMSSFHAGWSFGGLLGSAIAGVMAAAGVSLLGTLAVCGVAVALFALPALRLGRLGRSTTQNAGGRRRVGPGWGLVGVSAMACLCFVSEATVSEWGGIYLTSELAVSAAFAATGFAAYSAAMVIGRLLGDAAVRGLGPARVVRLGAGLAAAGLALALSVSNAGWAIAGLALVGLGLSNIVPVLFSAAGRRAGAPGIAMAATAGYGGLMGAPPVVGLAADSFGLGAALSLVIIGLGCVVLLAPLATYRASVTPEVA